ncbi:MAG: T9SS type A sorting domain-containing protein [Candidatus Cloacimonetes bacterium]|nr:T9SS type A sorting domain-containing protein [Candidatus Cloacimonadota bacterium]
MKKMLLLFAIMGIVFFAFATDFQVDHKPVTPVTAPDVTPQAREVSREVPEWEWAVEPVDLLSSYYDYFHAYTSIPIASQPAEHGGGKYLLYRTAESTGGTHNLSYSYVDNNYNVTTSAGVGCEGRYGDGDVDYATGNIFTSFHQSSSNVIFLYDLYHIMLTPGLWLDPPVTVLDVAEMQTNGVYPYDNDEFVWPKVAVSTSPVSADHRRVYVIPMNATSSHGSEGLPSENVVICYADFTTADLELQSPLDWSYRTIEQMDAWNAEDPEWARPQISMEVHDNVVILMGYLAHSDINGYQDDELLVLLNENYGEGDFEMFTQVATFDQENPTYIDTDSDSTYYLYRDAATPDVPYACKQDIIHSGHFNLVWNEDYSSISFAGSMGITFDSGTGPGYYYPGWNQIYPKRWTFDMTTHEFGFQDIYPQGANPNDDMPMQPWDLDEDGEYDAVYDDGMPMWEEVWPIFYQDPDAAFHNNETFTTSNMEMGWQAIFWVDGTYNKLATDGITGYEDWGGFVEIACVVSGNYGQTWTEPFFVNAKSDDVNYSSALDGLKPCFLFPADVIDIIDAEERIGRVVVLFYDDNDFGSFVNGNAGQPNGGTYQYAAFDITFPEPVIANDENIIPAIGSLKAYPNPFTPGTTRAGISVEFASLISAPAEISVYNLRGQKIETLFNENVKAGETLKVNWSADNATSGIYFFKLEAAGTIAASKVAVIK